MQLKEPSNTNQLTDEFVLSHLKALLNEDMQAIYVSDLLIAHSIKEYLCHLLNEVGGIKDLHKYHSIVFAGSCEKPMWKIILHLAPLPSNTLNALLGV